MRLHMTSAGLEPTSLRPGHDLVIEADPIHGTDLPQGTVVDDHLGLEDRREVERVASGATAQWRAQMDPLLTVDGLCLPFIWEALIRRQLNRVTLISAGILAAVETYGPDQLELSGGDRATALLVEAVAAASGLSVEGEPVVSTAAGDGASAPRGRRIRRAALAPVRRAGIPSHLRQGSVLFVSYWPLEPLLDRMLEQRSGTRPAVFLDKLPSGVRRALRAAVRGGWVGSPAPSDRRVAGSAAARALKAAEAPPRVEGLGVSLGAAVHESIMPFARERITRDLARARMLRRVLARTPPACVVSAWDSEPDARLVVTIAKEAGIRTSILSHGAYLQPTLATDMDLGDEILLWSRAMERPTPPAGTPVHVVGYPVPHSPPPPTRRFRASAEPPRIVVIAQPAIHFPLIDRRIEMRQYLTAIDAIQAHAPSAVVVLRPHPERGRAAAASAAERCPAARIETDLSPSILDVVKRADLCIGTASAATLQAALVGTPVIALNLGEYDWLWPLGGDTSVPLARSGSELERWLERWLGGEQLPGQQDLLDGLGADGGDSSARMLEAIGAAPDHGGSGQRG